jgi:hypothetical protein
MPRAAFPTCILVLSGCQRDASTSHAVSNALVREAARRTIAATR